MADAVSKKRSEVDQLRRQTELALRVAELARTKDPSRSNLMKRNLAARASNRAYSCWCDEVLGKRPRVSKGLLQK